MAIFRKAHLDADRRGLTRYYHELMAALDGTQPQAGQAAQYHQNSEDFLRDFTDVDLDELLKAIGRFKVEVEALKRIAKKQQKPIHRK